MTPTGRIVIDPLAPVHLYDRLGMAVKPPEAIAQLVAQDFNALEERVAAALIAEVDGVTYQKHPVPEDRPNPCAGCCAEYDLKLCSNLPYCGDTLGDKEVIFIRVSPS